MWENVKRVIGSKAARKLTQSLPDKFVYVPGRPTKKLTNVIGPEAAASLSSEFGGRKLKIPSGRRDETEIRNSHIRALSNQGVSARSLALRFGLSLRQIYKIKEGS